MYIFKKENIKTAYQEAYAQVEAIETIAKALASQDITEIYMLGCGGAFTKFMSVRSMLINHLHIPVIVSDPKEFLYGALSDVDEHALIIMGTKTGVTEEILEVAQIVHEKGLCLLGFVGDKDTPFERYSDYKICSVSTDVHIILLHLLFLCYLQEKGFAMDYPTFKENMRYFGDDLVAAIEDNLEKGKAYVDLALPQDFQMWVTSGNLWGEINCFCKYMIEEVQWKNAQPVHSGEFFHGPLELVEPSFCINVVINDDVTRAMDERVANFIKQYGKAYTIIDMRDFKLPHVEKKFLPYVYPYVLNMYFDELAEMYKPLTHRTMETRRYYRKVAY